MSSEDGNALVVDVGRKKVLSAKHTLCFNFHNFEDLTQVPGESVTSPSVRCHGLLWSLKLYPRGISRLREGPVYVCIFLKCKSERGESPKVKCSLRAGDGVRRPGRMFLFRADVVDPTSRFLNDGTLAVKVDYQLVQSKPEVWRPQFSIEKETKELFQSKKFADVTFSVGGEQIQAHRVIVAMRAPSLAALAGDVNKDDAIQIDGVNPWAFRALLRFIYSGELPEKMDILEDAKTLLDAADKFECSTLKLLVETKIAESSVTLDSVVDLLLYADSRNCALLWEVAVNFFVANSTTVMKGESFSSLNQSPAILTELMRAIAKPKVYDQEDSDVDRLSVGSLRRKLDEAGLDVDGTREMLVKRLKQSSESESTGDGGSL